MWPNSYWPNSYWPNSYWPGDKGLPVSPLSPDTGGGLFIFDQESDGAWAVDSVPIWVLSNLPKQPSQVINSPHLGGGTKALSVLGSPGITSNSFGNAPQTISPGYGANPVADVLGEQGSAAGTIKLKGGSKTGVYVEGSIGNS